MSPELFGRHVFCLVKREVFVMSLDSDFKSKVPGVRGTRAIGVWLIEGDTGWIGCLISEKQI